MQQKHILNWIEHDFLLLSLDWKQPLHWLGLWSEHSGSLEMLWLMVPSTCLFLCKCHWALGITPLWRVSSFHASVSLTLCLFLWWQRWGHLMSPFLHWYVSREFNRTTSLRLVQTTFLLQTATKYAITKSKFLGKEINHMLPSPLAYFSHMVLEMGMQQC